MQEAGSEHESWLKLCLREARRHAFKHVIVLQHALPPLPSLSNAADVVVAHDNVTITAEEFDEPFTLMKLGHSVVDYVLTYQGYDKRHILEQHNATEYTTFQDEEQETKRKCSGSCSADTSTSSRRARVRTRVSTRRTTTTPST